MSEKAEFLYSNCHLNCCSRCCNYDYYNKNVDNVRILIAEIHLIRFWNLEPFIKRKSYIFILTYSMQNYVHDGWLIGVVPVASCSHASLSPLWITRNALRNVLILYLLHSSFCLIFNPIAIALIGAYIFKHLRSYESYP